jgi:hypothetical protein
MRRKIFYLLGCLCVIFTSLALCLSCSSNEDDDNTPSTSDLEENYITIENAIYKEGAIPDSTTKEVVEGIDMSDQVMNGAMNYITVVTEQEISEFYIGVKNVSGYLSYSPTESTSRANGSLHVYIIPLMMSLNYMGDSTLILSAMLMNGYVTATVELRIYYIETVSGAIEVKLAFSNSKDVDLHLITPSGEHISYENRGGTILYGTSLITYGLDVDSNAACFLDNINKENIYIPTELVENGVYTVIVDMYSNCDPSVATSWSVTARYQGELVTPTTGHNPASGIYPVNAENGDMTTVMTFKISNADSRAVQEIRSNCKFIPSAPSEKDLVKRELLGE